MSFYTLYDNACRAYYVREPPAEPPDVNWPEQEEQDDDWWPDCEEYDQGGGRDERHFQSLQEG